MFYSDQPHWNPLCFARLYLAICSSKLYMTWAGTDTLSCRLINLTGQKCQLTSLHLAGDFGLYFSLKIRKLQEQYQAGVDNDLLT
jgi:hypothetical protein